MKAFRLEKGEKIWHDLVMYEGLRVRKGFGPDESTPKEWKATYKHMEHLIEGHTVLDIGANIGIFTNYSIERFGAVRSFPYEPEPGAFSVLTHNVPNAINKAVGKGNKTVSLSLAPSGNAVSASTVFSKRGRQSIEVEQVDAFETIEKHKPSLVKSDCEGAELDWMFGDRLPSCVKLVTAELHREEPGQEDKCKKLIRSFKKWREVHPPKSYSFHRCWIVCWERK